MPVTLAELFPGIQIGFISSKYPPGLMNLIPVFIVYFSLLLRAVPRSIHWKHIHPERLGVSLSSALFLCNRILVHHLNIGDGNISFHSRPKFITGIFCFFIKYLLKHIVIWPRHGNIDVIIPGNKSTMPDRPDQRPIIQNVTQLILFTDLNDLTKHIQFDLLTFLQGYQL